MKFAKQIIAPCRVNPATATACDTDGDGEIDQPGPSVDPRCSDPAWRKAHPNECDGYPVLILKPATASVCMLRSQKFRAFLYANNTEVEITTGLTWASSNQAVAQIGVLSGKVTGVAEGIATISVSWQDQTAYSQVTVLPEACCDVTKVGMVIVIDNSLSMTQVFGAGFATKLSFAKTTAYRFASEINTVKDVAALMTFNEAGTEVLPLDDDVAALKTAITAVVSTNKSTNIGDALGDAIKILDDDSTITRKVIVLFSDGNNQEGDDPVAIADEFEERGGIIQVVGVRAFGDGFDLLNQIATGGFFLNAHSASYKTVPDQMSGLKGYYCAGNCTPPGDVTINRAALMWGTAVGAFAKWDVVRGAVDLIGGTPPYELFDLLPGNGLYVDLAGSAPWPLPPNPTGVWMGKIQTKDEWDFFADTTYRLTFKLAGNQREATPSGMHYRVRVTVAGSSTMLNEVITIDDYAQGFTEYSFDFTGPGGGRLTFELIEQADVPAFGLLLDDVRLVSDPDGIAEVRFEDDFDDENSVYIEPKCGPSFVAGYGYGYDCYGYGCLSEPVDVQTEDPAPQPDTLETAGTTTGGGGGGGGGGGSSESFDPAGMFVTLTHFESELAKYLPLAGGEMEGDLTLAGAPTESLHAATKAYVDAAMGSVDLSDYLPIAGGTMEGFITLHAAPTADLHAATKAYVDAAIGDIDLSPYATTAYVDTNYLALSGGTLTGHLISEDDLTIGGWASFGSGSVTISPAGVVTLAGAPTDPLHAATKAYVDAVATAGVTDYVNVTGDTMTGPLLLPSGSAGAPALSFSAASTMGLYNISGSLYASIGATEYFGVGYGSAVCIGQGAPLAFFSGGIFGNGAQTFLRSDAANTLALRNSTAAQTFRLYSTYTDASNYGRLSVSSGAGFVQLVAERAGTTATQDLYLDATIGTLNFRTATTTRFQLTTSGHLVCPTDNTYDIGAIGTTRPRNVNIGSNLLVPVAQVSSWIYFGSGGYFIPISSGVMLLSDLTNSTFTRLILGTNDASGVSIKKNGTAIDFRLGNDSAACAITALTLTTSGTITSSAGDLVAAGNLTCNQVLAGSHVRAGATTQIYWNSRSVLTSPSDGVIRMTNGAGSSFTSLELYSDVVLSRKAANSLELRNSTNAQALSIAGTWTDASNNEYLYAKGVAAASFEIGTIKAGTGTARSLCLKPETGLLQIGGTTSSYPAFKLNSMNLDLRLADDSAYTGMRVGALHTEALTVDDDGVAPTAGGTAPTLTDFYGSDGFALTTPAKWIKISCDGSTYVVPGY